MINNNIIDSYSNRVTKLVPYLVSYYRYSPMAVVTVHVLFTVNNYVNNHEKV